MRELFIKLIMVPIMLLNSIIGVHEPKTYANLGNLDVIAVYKDCSDVTVSDEQICVSNKDKSIQYTYQIFNNSSAEIQEELLADEVSALLEQFSTEVNEPYLLDGTIDGCRFSNIACTKSGKQSNYCVAYKCIGGSTFIQIHIKASCSYTELKGMISALLSSDYLSYKGDA